MGNMQADAYGAQDTGTQMGERIPQVAAGGRVAPAPFGAPPGPKQCSAVYAKTGLPCANMAKHGDKCFGHVRENGK